ncbi:MAG: succinate dehydrogenase cytochrome b subunit [Gemmatimonadota bacterium]
MRRVQALYHSSVGKKVAMASSGVILFGYVLMHMLGNLKAFQGREALDGYAEFLRQAGYPLIPENGLLWFVRILLLGAVGLHILAAWQLWRRSSGARSHGYRKNDSQVFNYASRTMRWGGVIIVAFVIYHLLHLTTGSVHPDFEHGSVYDNLVIGFQSIPVAGFYLIAVGALSLHLHHGLWSAFATFGVENARIDRIRRPLAAGIAIAMFVGYATVPIAVLSGLLSL